MPSNTIEAIQINSLALPEIKAASELSPDLLRDESKMQGKADFASFPSSTEETAALMKWATEKQMKVTVSGGRTGIAGGAVPDGGLLVSLGKLQKISKAETDQNGETFINCGSGVLLSELQNYLRITKSPCFFPPDPTETSATIGGMVSCNASGAHTYAYGPTRNYVRAIIVVLADGSVLKLRRGEAKAGKDNSFILKKADGTQIKGHIPTYTQPNTKNAAGYYSGNEIDLVDLFIGSEGTLGTITETELKLIPVPEKQFNAMFFLSSETAAIELTCLLREEKSVDISAIEYFDPGALNLLRKRRETMKAASMVPPGMPENPGTAGIYIDVDCTNANVKEAAEKIIEAGQKLKSGKVLQTWAAFDRDERERLRKFRHALPETVNSIIGERKKKHPQITKLGTDMAVPDQYLSDIMKIYRETLESNSLEFVIFGHIGNNHVHVNILPSNPDEYMTGKKLYGSFAAQVLSMKGSVSAEHGIGRLKKNFLEMMLGSKGIEEMKALKKIFDPDNLLGQGILF